MQKTIFMVDDHLTNLAKAEELLEKHYMVITLSSAAKMFAVLEKIQPDLILLDIDMPEMDGLEAIKLLKADPKFAGIPVIFLTGLTGDDIQAYGIELGAADFVTKPFSEPVLLNRIKNYLRMAELIHDQTVRFHEQAEQIESLQDVLAQTLADIEQVNESTVRKAECILLGIKTRIESACDRP
jgi:putative two-component system response regulator